ncbi:hypothetical protein A3I48_03120 [Candidatus Daviesbacteria bacterium RIFCSPLOWO2_02_FULL_36_7]|uniref:Uncharacterized protein n=1 Tax=Candidatus Daviesbacteria bacterium RIFCSPLOWO2_02_FULL_36_7 TaxID=1797792 RepID=A0A1F5MG81_9BACT|nr:MAG: hypothetical protein A3I48_03120 [Candidatus Daviesbacteria bacterium RIFCSPLOWO2_02_FULL_36_7]
MSAKRVWYLDEVEQGSLDNIHQTLMFGSLKEIKSLLNVVGEKEVKKCFLGFPKKIYTASAFNFIKNFILGINTKIDEQRYLKNTPRHPG